jgi:hypothetical protein
MSSRMIAVGFRLRSNSEVKVDGGLHSPFVPGCAHELSTQ